MKGRDESGFVGMEKMIKIQIKVVVGGVLLPLDRDTAHGSDQVIGRFSYITNSPIFRQQTLAVAPQTLCSHCLI